MKSIRLEKKDLIEKQANPTEQSGGKPLQTLSLQELLEAVESAQRSLEDITQTTAKGEIMSKINRANDSLGPVADKLRYALEQAEQRRSGPVPESGARE